MAPSPLSASDAGPAFADVAALAQRLAQRATRAHTVMEVCGGQTHSIVRWGLDQLLPPDLRLIHGPGCPVCVTPAATIDAAITLARTPGVILCTYGDMARVPGSRPGVDLLEARAAGGDVRLLTSPLAALDLARTVPDHHVVFFAVGFETTAPATALLARQALALGLPNLSLLTAHVRVAPAMEAILADPSTAVEAFLAAGHVCSVLGTAELEALVERFQVPVVVTGFEPEDVMAGLCQALELLEAGRAEVANAYSRVVRPRGNPAARALLDAVFMPVDQPWRGLGLIPAGGLALRPPYDILEARRHFSLPAATDPGEPACPSCESACISGAILQGRATPDQCAAFGGACTPDHPLGAPMVSSEGACAAWYRYRR
ncbi:MAG: hydrogenase formation protein HypD [Cyanobacteriota bacterium]|jgi:hydrogenase expression/formation protein HypD